MRRTAAVLLLLLTATAAQAKSGGEAVAHAILWITGCCGGVPLLVIVSLVIALAIYDWRKARRPAPPPSDPPAVE